MTRMFVGTAAAVAFVLAVFTVQVALMLKMYESMGVLEIVAEILPIPNSSLLK